MPIQWVPLQLSSTHSVAGSHCLSVGQKSTTTEPRSTDDAFGRPGAIGNTGHDGRMAVGTDGEKDLFAGNVVLRQGLAA